MNRPSPAESLWQARSWAEETTECGSGRQCRRQRALHVVGSRDPAHVSPEPRLELFRNAGDPVPGGKDAMKEQAGSCVVGHRLAILMLSRPLRDFSFAYTYPALERQSARRAGLFSVAPAGALAQISNRQQRTTASNAFCKRKLWLEPVISAD